MRKSQLLSIIARIRGGATSPQNIFDSLNALATNPPYGGTAITTTLPTVLAQGEQVIYRDPNGVQSLWIGNADGEAWPACGFKEFSANLQFSTGDEFAGIGNVLINTIGEATAQYVGVSEFTITITGLATSFGGGPTVYTVFNNDDGSICYLAATNTSSDIISFMVKGADGSTLSPFDNYEIPITIRIYP